MGTELIISGNSFISYNELVGLSIPSCSSYRCGLLGWGQGQTAVNYQSDYSFLLTTATEPGEDNH